MYARVTRFKGEPARIDEGIKNIKETIVPGAKTLAGFKHGYWLLDRTTGEGFSVTLFDSEANVQASEDAAAKLRDQAATSGNQITGVERYEVIAEG